MTMGTVMAALRDLGDPDMHQERAFPGRVHATSLINPDFAALARAYGAHGERVERDADFPAAFERAREANVPAVLHLVVDPEAITPAETLRGLHVDAVTPR